MFGAPQAVAWSGMWSILIDHLCGMEMNEHPAEAGRAALLLSVRAVGPQCWSSLILCMGLLELQDKHIEIPDHSTDHFSLQNYRFLPPVF